MINSASAQCENPDIAGLIRATLAKVTNEQPASYICANQSEAQLFICCAGRGSMMTSAEDAEAVETAKTVEAAQAAEDARAAETGSSDGDI